MLIECKNVIKFYDKQSNPVLDGVTLNLESESFVSFMGRSGSGKSTLLRVLCGLEPINSGEVRVAGYDVTKLTAKDRFTFLTSVIGIVFQDSNLIDSFTVEDNILAPCLIAKKKVDKEHLNKLLEVTDLKEHLNKYPAQLSGGMRQRAAVARAVINKPQILFADEPTGSLDSTSEKDILKLFSELNKEFKTTIFMVTHSNECAEYSDKVVKIHDGKIQKS